MGTKKEKTIKLNMAKSTFVKVDLDELEDMAFANNVCTNTPLEQNYWLDLIAFDKDNIKGSVDQFIENVNGKIDSFYLHMVNCDFVAGFPGMDREYILHERDCAGFPKGEERARQQWTNYDLKNLIDYCHEKNIEVYYTIGGGTHPGNAYDFKKDHPELVAFSTRIAKHWGSYHFAKRLNDGRYFEDVLSAKLKEFMLAFGFDGIHLADVLTFPHMRVVNGDFTDDLVEQFVSRTGIKLPFNVTGTTIKEQQARYRYIINNLRYEWTRFQADRYGEFISKMIKAAHDIGKKTCLVNAWTCSPFEAFYRFGVDYRKYAEGGADKWMFEDAIGVTISSWRNNEFEITEDTRWNWNWRLMEKQGALKCCTMGMHMVNMTSIHDTNEQWNLIDNAPNEFRTNVAKRSVVYVWKGGKLVPSCEGSMYCLSDGVNKESWEKIHNVIDNFNVGEPIEALGFTALYDDDLDGQVKEFISTRRHNAPYVNYRFLRAGFPITARATKEELALSRGPLLVTAESVRDDNVKTYLENTDRLLVIAGYKTVLDKAPNAEFKCGDFTVKIYNSKNKKAKKSYNGYKKAALNYQDPVNAHWPMLPRMDTINDNLFTDVLDFVNKEDVMPYGLMPYMLKDAKGKSIYPKTYKKGNYKIFTYKMSESHYRMLVVNNDSWFAHPIIKLPFKAKSVVMIGKGSWSPSPLRPDGLIMLKLNNRSSELLDIYV